eukprot:PhF_6_TR26055/c2_g1_i1/m.36702
MTSVHSTQMASMWPVATSTSTTATSGTKMTASPSNKSTVKGSTPTALKTCCLRIFTHLVSVLRLAPSGPPRTTHVFGTLPSVTVSSTIPSKGSISNPDLKAALAKSRMCCTKTSQSKILPSGRSGSDLNRQPIPRRAIYCGRTYRMLRATYPPT